MTFLALWIAGLLMIFMEFYLPGAILGTIGGLMLVASIILVVQMGAPLLITLIYIVLVLASLTALIKYALWKIPKTKSKGSIYSDDSQVGYYASSFDLDAIGKEGIVLSDLKPGGFIEIDGKQLAAISESGYVSKGERIKVLRGEGDSLIVTKIKG